MTRITLSRTADYVELLECVQIHGYRLMRKQDRALPPSEIAVDWYERVYAPVTDEVRRETATRNGQTEGDLFLQLYRRRRDRYAERGCPSLEETVAEAMVRPLCAEGALVEPLGHRGRAVKFVPSILW